MIKLIQVLKKSLWQDNKSLFLFIALMLVFRSAVADWNEVPTGSMKPTIVEGDRILVNKLAYDIRIPFTHVSLFELDNPKRGDIVIFDSKVSKKRLVKRVIGLPGDRIAMRENQLIINGKAINYLPAGQTESAIEYREQLFNNEHIVQVSPSSTSHSSFAEVTVPDGHYLVLGDNRDNSADSRFIGFVPRNEIVGRTERVVISFNYDNYYLPRKDRFFHAL